MAQADKGVSPEEMAWIDEFMRFKVSERIGDNLEAGKAADLLSKALGGSAPKENVEGWLQSVPEVIDMAAVRAVKESEKVVSAQSVELEPGKLDEPESVKVEAEDSDEIPDGVYEELAAALAEDLTDALADAEQKLFKFLVDDDDGLCAGVRDQILNELRERELLGGDPSLIAGTMREPAWTAITEAFSGLYEALEADGGYKWLLTREEA